MTAFLGGQLAQDVINVIGQRSSRFRISCCLMGRRARGRVYALHPVFDAGGLLDAAVAAPMGVSASVTNGAVAL